MILSSSFDVLAPAPRSTPKAPQPDTAGKSADSTAFTDLVNAPDKQPGGDAGDRRAASDEPQVAEAQSLPSGEADPPPVPQDDATPGNTAGADAEVASPDVPPVGPASDRPIETAPSTQSTPNELPGNLAGPPLATSDKSAQAAATIPGGEATSVGEAQTPRLGSEAERFSANQQPVISAAPGQQPGEAARPLDARASNPPPTSGKAESASLFANATTQTAPRGSKDAPIAATTTSIAAQANAQSASTKEGEADPTRTRPASVTAVAPLQEPERAATAISAASRPDAEAKVPSAPGTAIPTTPSAIDRPTGTPLAEGAEQDPDQLKPGAIKPETNGKSADSDVSCRVISDDRRAGAEIGSTAKITLGGGAGSADPSKPALVAPAGSATMRDPTPGPVGSVVPGTEIGASDSIAARVPPMPGTPETLQTGVTSAPALPTGDTFGAARSRHRYADVEPEPRTPTAERQSPPLTAEMKSVAPSPVAQIWAQAQAADTTQTSLGQGASSMTPQGEALPPPIEATRLESRGVSDASSFTNLSQRTAGVASPAHQLADAVRQNAASGQGATSLEVALHPEELGRVRLVFTSAEAGLAVTVQADRSETLEMLRRHIDLLGNELRSQGYGEVAFNFGGHPSGGSSDAWGGAEQAAFGIDGSDPETVDQTPIQPALRATSSPTSAGLDLRL